MALLTVNTELALTEAGNYVLISQVSRALNAQILCFTPCFIVGFLTAEASADNQSLRSKQRMVSAGAEFGRKQRHEIGPRSILKKLSHLRFS